MSFKTPAYVAQQDDIQRRRNIAGERAATPEPTTEQIRAFLERESLTVQQEATKQRNEEIGTAWVASHPEYKRSPHSSLMMDEFLNSRGLPVTDENLTAAFSYLSQKGLIETNAALVQEQVRTRVQQDEIQRRAAAAKLPTVEELYEMPLEDLQALVYRTR